MSDDDHTVKLSANVSKKGSEPEVLLIEPFYGGSHKELIDVTAKSLTSYTLVTLPSKKWHWRARCAALCLYGIIPKITSEKVLFCSSVLNLAELIGLRPDLCKLKKIIYFHENQFMYPVQEIKKRDIQYPYNQITSALAADVILFNSHYNMDTFLNNIHKVMKLIPDHRPKNLETSLRHKSEVLYFPIEFPVEHPYKREWEETDLLKIVWPHRWEFDKGPDDFFNILFRLKSEGVPFRLAVLGECYNEIPQIFPIAKNRLEAETYHWGYVPLKSHYYSLLNQADVVVSTAKHEFFGVAMLEAVYCGCFPLVPKRLVYEEIYPNQCWYSDLDDLYLKLRHYCCYPYSANSQAKHLQSELDVTQYSDKKLVPKLLKIFNCEDDTKLESVSCNSADPVI